MSIWNAVKSALKSGSREISKEYGKTPDFLNAVAASAALVANADGSIEDAERTKTISLIRNHSTLSQLYNGEQIESAVDRMLKLSKDLSGKQELARNIDKICGLEGGKTMAEDVYLIAADIAAADGSVGEEEQKVLTKIASRLSVDPKKFEF